MSENTSDRTVNVAPEAVQTFDRLVAGAAERLNKRPMVDTPFDLRRNPATVSEVGEGIGVQCPGHPYEELLATKVLDPSEVLVGMMTAKKITLKDGNPEPAVLMYYVKDKQSFSFATPVRMAGEMATLATRKLNLAPEAMGEVLQRFGEKYAAAIDEYGTGDGAAGPLVATQMEKKD